MRPNFILRIVYTSFLFFVIAMLMLNQGCQKKPESGEELAKLYCTGCHLLPKPNELTKELWQNKIIPKMGYIVGVKSKNWPPSVLKSFQDLPEGKLEQKKSPYLASTDALLSEEEYDEIMKYYVENAPESLDFKNPHEDLPVTALFKPKIVSLNQDLGPSTTMTSFLAPGRLMVADYYSKRLIQLNEELEIRFDIPLEKAVVQFQKTENAYWATVFGDRFEGSDAPDGFMMRYSQDPAKAPTFPIVKLKRPSDAQIADVDMDGLDDWVICEFGKYTGGLSWWRNTGNGYERKELLNLPGAINSEILDWDNDGDLDIIALFGQAKEAIYFFSNNGNGTFKTIPLLEFPASYGSTNLIVTDYNEDGLQDIIYSNGDLGDYTPTPKPYHGIRIFLNEGNNQLKEKLFIPVPGIYKSLFLDVDNDGDCDFLSISFFPSEGQHSFVLHQNDGNNTFIPSGISNQYASRWMVMDHMDYDEDGDQDIVLGGFQLMGDNYENKIGLLYLENIGSR